MKLRLTVHPTNEVNSYEKENKGRLTGGVNPQGNMEGNAHKDPKSALENNAKSNTKR